MLLTFHNSGQMPTAPLSDGIQMPAAGNQPNSQLYISTSYAIYLFLHTASISWSILVLSKYKKHRMDPVTFIFLHGPQGQENDDNSRLARLSVLVSYLNNIDTVTWPNKNRITNDIRSRRIGRPAFVIFGGDLTQFGGYYNGRIKQPKIRPIMWANIHFSGFAGYLTRTGTVAAILMILFVSTLTESTSVSGATTQRTNLDPAANGLAITSYHKAVQATIGVIRCGTPFANCIPD